MRNKRCHLALHFPIDRIRASIMLDIASCFVISVVVKTLLLLLRHRERPTRDRIEGQRIGEVAKKRSLRAVSVWSRSFLYFCFHRKAISQLSPQQQRVNRTDAGNNLVSSPFYGSHFPILKLYSTFSTFIIFSFFFLLLLLLSEVLFPVKKIYIYITGGPTTQRGSKWQIRLLTVSLWTREMVYNQ